MDDNYSTIDPLIYSRIQNKIDDNDMISGYEKAYYISGGSNGIRQQQLNNVLDKTVIRKACCLGLAGSDNGIRVKIPIPANYNDSTDGPGGASGTIQKQHKYIEKTIYVPLRMCEDGYAPQTAKCDAFMNVYCDNTKQTYKQQARGGIYIHNDFITYSPECACYGDNPDYSKLQISPKCSLKGCYGAGINAYMDSSYAHENCANVICNSTFNISDLAAASATIANTVTQNCSANQQSKLASNPTKTPESPTEPSTPTQPIQDTGTSTMVPATTSDNGIASVLGSLFGTTPASSTDTSASGTSGNKDTTAKSSNTTLYIGIAVAIFICICMMVLLIVLMK